MPRLRRRAQTSTIKGGNTYSVKMYIIGVRPLTPETFIALNFNNRVKHFTHDNTGKPILKINRKHFGEKLKYRVLNLHFN